MRLKRLLCALAALLLLPTALGEAPQGGEIAVPELNDICQYEIPDTEAMAFLKRMGVGWNLGNTFDAVRDTAAPDEMSIERYWCGETTTEAMIEAVRDAGFSTVRIPVSWHNHVDADFNLSQPWLDRVQQVADWALARGMTVILNTHHDVYPEYYYPTEEHRETSERYIARVWAQLAERFAEYDDHLIFESMNEPRMKDSRWEWWLNENEPECQEAVACVNRLNQLFVDTVRATGGMNADRYLMVPGYDASASSALSERFTLPEDSADHRLIVSVHAYTPYSFALEEPGTDRFTLKSFSQTREINDFMGKLYSRYIREGIPVVIGEFGAREKNGNLQSRVDFAAFYVASASARNIPCCWWDNNVFTGDGERFGLFRRRDCAWPYPEIVGAIMRYAGYDSIAARPE